MTYTKCPSCKKEVEWSDKSAYRPFCSQRCQLLDMGGWLDGSHSIPGVELVDDQLSLLQEGSSPANDDESGWQ